MTDYIDKQALYAAISQTVGQAREDYDREEDYPSLTYYIKLNRLYDRREFLKLISDFPTVTPPQYTDWHSTVSDPPKQEGRYLTRCEHRDTGEASIDLLIYRNGQFLCCPKERVTHWAMPPALPS